MRLFHFYERVFAAGLDVRAAIRTGANRNRPVDEVQRELGALLDEVEKRAMAAGRVETDIREASFAVICWLDEVIASDPDWFGFSAQPLQVIRFGTFQGGEEFYEHLSGLRERQDEAREVYYVALSLGFLGRYALDPESQEWHAILANQARQIPVRPVNPLATLEEKVTPQPYGVALPTTRVVPRRPGRHVIKIVAALALSIPLCYFVYLWFQGEDGHGYVDLKVTVNALIAEETCASMSAQISDGADGARVVLSGFDSSEESLRTLRAKLLRLNGVDVVDVAAVKIIPRPLCIAAESLSRYTIDENLRLSLKGGGVDLPMNAQIVVEAQSALGFEAHLYVDVFSPDGAVAHMRPENVSELQALPPGSTITVGETLEGGLKWTAAEPGGPHLLVAISSRSALFAHIRESSEDSKEYLAALEAALASAPADSVVIRYVLLRFGE